MELKTLNELGTGSLLCSIWYGDLCLRIGEWTLLIMSVANWREKD